MTAYSEAHTTTSHIHAPALEHVISNTEGIDPERYRSLIDLFEQATHKYGDQPAYINLGLTLSFTELEQRSRALAGYFQQQLQIKPGQRVAIMLPNCLQYPITFFAIIRCGAVVVNVNPLYTPRELKHQLQDSGATAVVVLSHFAHTVQAVKDECSIKHVIVSELADEHSYLKRKLIYTTLKYIKKKIPPWQIDGVHPYRHCLSIGKNLDYQRPSINLNEIALLQYTGGTTGIAKGAILSHRNLLANIEQIKAVYGDQLVPGKESIVSVLPFYHIFALMINCLLFLEIGGTSLLISNPYDINGMVKTLRRYPFSVISGVNTLYARLLANEAFKRLNFQSLKIAVAGGMAMQPTVARAWEALTGTYILEGYGLTECSPLVAINPRDIRSHTGTIGKPIAATEIMLLADDGQPVGPGNAGELCVRGPQVMQGYWQQTETINPAIDNQGWLHTGDLAICDEQGLLRLVGRKKEMILVSGFNVYPSEIETVLQQHSQIEEAVAIGTVSESSGEAIKVFVVRKDERLTEREVIDYCRKHLTGYKVPKLIEFRDTLPKNPLGKVLRHALTAD